MLQREAYELLALAGFEASRNISIGRCVYPTRGYYVRGCGDGVCIGHCFGADPVEVRHLYELVRAYGRVLFRGGLRICYLRSGTASMSLVVLGHRTAMTDREMQEELATRYLQTRGRLHAAE